jgi:PhzF family phenazine biosynthesis protein
MMKNKIYQVDAFADKVFSGNPAAVCPLNEWLNDDLLQKIAMENNLAETAFYVRENDQFFIRWFTPAAEVDLCGNATIAAAFVLFNHENHKGDTIYFYTPRSADLPETKNQEFLTLNFPVDNYRQIELSPEIIDCFDLKPISGYKGKTDYLFVFENEQDIINIDPSFEKIAKLDGRGVIITAKGNEADFVSRFFAPRAGINEDPVTGSAHTTLIPYWAKQLGKVELSAIQLSSRKGHLQCTLKNDRVEIKGKAKLYLTGEIYID